MSYFQTLVKTGSSIFLFALLSASIHATPPSNSAWSMTFNDEFNGTSLDLVKWDTIDVCCGHSDHDEYYLGRNCVVENGLLREVLKRESVQGSKFTSGAVTARTFKQQYGYYEMRAKMPPGNGLWPAFWMLGSGWEIDIMEFWTTDVTDAQSRFHYWVGGWSASGPVSYANPSKVDYTKGFHIFGMEWKPDNTLEMYLDDVYAGRLVWDFALNKSIPGLPLCMNLQSETTGWHPPIDNTTPLPAYYDIDWVRVYRKDATALHLTSTPTAIVFTGSQYTYAIAATGTPPPTITVSGLPTWLSFNATTATISGTPTAIGTTDSITVTATNSQGSTRQKFAITVTNGCDLLTNNNPGYESGAISPWNSAWGSGTVVTGNAHSGTYAVHLSGAGAGFNWNKTGLTANTTYTLSAWVKVASVADSTALVVKDYGGSEISVYAKTTSYSQISLTFTTGAGSTQASIGTWKPTGSGTAYIDDWKLLTIGSCGSTQNIPGVDRLQKAKTTGTITGQIYSIDGKLIAGPSAHAKMQNGIYIVKTSGNQSMHRIFIAK